MARKKVKRYDNGGEIVVSGNRAADAAMLDRMMRERSFVGGGGDSGGGSLGSRFGGDDSGGGGSSSPKMSAGKVRTPVGKVFGVRGIPVGERGSFDFGASPMDGGKVGGTFRTSFKKGGSTKKMAKGGSVSKRADGCATKGKTKGRFV
jgi:hypothetical protein